MVNSTNDEEVLFEHTHQLGAFLPYVYHVKNKGSKVIVQNQGMGDVFVSIEGLKNANDSRHRMLFRESKEFGSVDILYFISSSQPVITIIEEKQKFNSPSC